MRILHSSDWHIGRTLYGKKRYAEFEAFLDWMAQTLQEQSVDVLVVAGDIFDTTTPSHYAQELYYRFLCKVAASSCRHVIIVAGNHDSPSLLNAPKELLKALNVHVVGSGSETPQDDVIVLRDAQNVPRLIVCAVPYLRDKDIRTVQAGESTEDKERLLIDGIRAHYAAIAQHAEQQRSALGSLLPVIATGHLFAAGGQTIDGDGVRDLYIGSLAHVHAGIFPPTFDYVALGHLHVPQEVDGRQTIQYSGSPLPMGFGEAGQNKSVCLVDLDGRTARVSRLQVPVFQALERIQGDWDDIQRRVRALATFNAPVWLEVIYVGESIMGDLRERLETEVAGTALDILRVKNSRVVDRVLEQMHHRETLDDLSVDDVFARCLALHAIPADQQQELLLAYRQTLLSLDNDDTRAQ
jgi:exonuclease SbcD